jgi:asparagine synthetase B (glutamine-hydrolysing)
VFVSGGRDGDDSALYRVDWGGNGDADEWSACIRRNQMGLRSVLWCVCDGGQTVVATTGPAIRDVHGGVWIEASARAVTRITIIAESGLFRGELVPEPMLSAASWCGTRSVSLIEPPEHGEEAPEAIEREARGVISALAGAVQRSLLRELVAGSSVAVLFSGGLDSTVLAAVIDRCVPPGVVIELINVAFAAKDEVALFESVPDRQAGRKSFVDLRTASPSREFVFVAVDVTETEARHELPRVLSIMHPADTYMDVTIGLAEWFAARGVGRDGIVARSRLLAVGQASDEQFGGYARYRSYSMLWMPTSTGFG